MSEQCFDLWIRMYMEKIGSRVCDECGYTLKRCGCVITKKFYPQNTRAGFAENSPIFWRKGGGYSPYLDQAEEFDEATADAHVRSCKGTHDFRKWPVEETKAKAHQVVDVQDFPPSLALEATR